MREKASLNTKRPINSQFGLQGLKQTIRFSGAARFTVTSTVIIDYCWVERLSYVAESLNPNIETLNPKP